MIHLRTSCKSATKVFKTLERTQTGRQVDESELLPLVRHRDETTGVATVNRSAAALTSPHVHNVLYDVLDDVHISKAGVKQILNWVINEVYIPSFANIAHRLD